MAALLSHVVARTRLRPAQACAIALGVLEQLETRHLASAKPSHVVLSERGVFLLDHHRLALVPQPRPPAAQAEVVSWYCRGLLNGEEPTEHTDVATIALLAVGLMAGRSPYLRADGMETLRAANDNRWSQPLEVLVPGIARTLADVLTRALAGEPLAAPSSEAQVMAPADPRAPLASWLRHHSGAETPASVWQALHAASHVTGPVEIPPAPETREARLVAADALEETGVEGLAQWVRLELELRQAPVETKEELRQRLARLTRALGAEVVAPWVQAPVEACLLHGPCPGRWDALAPTEAPTRRRCQRCARDVHLELTSSAAYHRVAFAETVVVSPCAQREPGDLELSEDAWMRT